MFIYIAVYELWEQYYLTANLANVLNIDDFST